MLCFARLMRCVAREFWRSSGYMYELGTTGRAGRGGVKTEGDDRCVRYAMTPGARATRRCD